jgi:LemA protein
MKKSLNTVLFLGLVIFLSSCGYNGGIERQEKVAAAWGQVQNVYQRRADLIPNLVNTVKGFAQQEKDVLTGVVEARAKATSININADNLNPESLQKFQQAQDGLSSALSRLLMVTENYPELKSNQNFLELQSQLEGTENRIAVERRNFNEAVQDYNTFGKTFPNNLFSSWWGFEKKAYFEAQQGADKVPTVKF